MSKENKESRHTPRQDQPIFREEGIDGDLIYIDKNILLKKADGYKLKKYCNLCNEWKHYEFTDLKNSGKHLIKPKQLDRHYQYKIRCNLIASNGVKRLNGGKLANNCYDKYPDQLKQCHSALTNKLTRNVDDTTEIAIRFPLIGPQLIMRNITHFHHPQYLPSVPMGQCQRNRSQCSLAVEQPLLSAGTGNISRHPSKSELKLLEHEQFQNVGDLGMKAGYKDTCATKPVNFIYENSSMQILAPRKSNASNCLSAGLQHLQGAKLNAKFPIDFQKGDTIERKEFTQDNPMLVPICSWYTSKKQRVSC